MFAARHMILASGSERPVAFRSIGAGGGANSKALSWTEDIAAGDGVIVFGAIYTQAAVSLAATVDGGAMSILQSPILCDTVSINRLYLYALGITGSAQRKRIDSRYESGRRRRRVLPPSELNRDIECDLVRYAGHGHRRGRCGVGRGE